MFERIKNLLFKNKDVKSIHTSKFQHYTKDQMIFKYLSGTHEIVWYNKTTKLFNLMICNNFMIHNFSNFEYATLVDKKHHDILMKYLHTDDKIEVQFIVYEDNREDFTIEKDFIRNYAEERVYRIYKPKPKGEKK